MKKFTHVSASQVSTYMSCKRQWYWNKVLGLPTKQKPSAALGEAVHNSIEKYLEGGTAIAEAAVGQGTLYLFGPEILFRAQPHGTFRLLFNTLYSVRPPIQ